MILSRPRRLALGAEGRSRPLPPRLMLRLCRYLSCDCDLSLLLHCHERVGVVDGLTQWI